MEKNFIFYEQSLALKELGFNEPCLGYYIELRNPQEGILTIDKCENNIDGVLALLYQQAFRWFRDVHSLKGEVKHSNANGSNRFTIWRNNKDNVVGQWERIGCIGTYDTWEQAELACLNRLIEILKDNGKD